MVRDEAGKTKKSGGQPKPREWDRMGLGAVRGTTKRRVCVTETSGRQWRKTVNSRDGKRKKEKVCSVRVVKRTQENTKGEWEERKRLQAFE